MTKKEILSLKPTFKFGGFTMYDWFTITESTGFYCISSGLRHADGGTKSPFFYEECVGGEDCESKSLEKFTEWWEWILKIYKFSLVI